MEDPEICVTREFGLSDAFYGSKNMLNRVVRAWDLQPALGRMGEEGYYAGYIIFEENGNPLYGKREKICVIAIKTHPVVKGKKGM